MKRVCIFNGDMSRGGGTERITQVLANLLVETEKYEIHVLNLRNADGSSFFSLNDQVSFEILRGEAVQEKVWHLYRYVCQKHIDILIEVDIMLGIFALPVKLLVPRLRLIGWEMFNIRNDIGSRNTYAIRQLSLHLCSYYVTQTKGDMLAFQKEMKVRCPMNFVYNPCEYDENYLEYHPESKTIVSVGNVIYIKGFEFAVEVARIVFAKHPDWKWCIFGDGNKLESLTALVKQYSLEEHFRFCGRVKNLKEVYQNASMFVMTSRMEGFGLVLLEAKAENLPTIAFDVDFGPREIIEDQVSGYLIPPFDVDQMAERINLLIEDDQKRVEFAAQAKRNMECFTQKAFLESWEAILQEVVNKKRKR